MKNIKLRIVYLILCSALLLFALFMLAVNLIIPAHFVREAKKALISEAQYQNRTIPYTDDGSFFDDEWNDTEEHFLTPSIVFLELDNANQSSVWNRDAYRLEKELLEYCKGRDLSLNQCYTFKTDRHHLIFMSAQENYGDGEEPYSYIMYIDIGPITRYIVTLNWVFFAVLLAISSVMCLLGFRFGRDIEKEAERQQTFFQNASHELKTPLTTIKGFGEMFGSGMITKEDDVAKYGAMIERESERLLFLINDIIRLSEIEEHTEMLNTPVDLAAAAGNALQILEPQIQRNRIQVHLEGRCLLLHSNEGYMRELFINLIDNAIKYNNPGGTVSITIEHVGTQAKIVIADNGIGIPLQAQSRIFERFYRVDKSRSKQRGGTGLGLSIVKHIVDCHNGTISLRSELGHGTEITLLLPEK